MKHQKLRYHMRIKRKYIRHFWYMFKIFQKIKRGLQTKLYLFLKLRSNPSMILFRSKPSIRQKMEIDLNLFPFFKSLLGTEILCSKLEQHHITILDNIFLSFHLHFSFFSCGSPTSSFHQITPLHDIGLYKFFLEIRMNHSGCLWS